MTTTVRRRVDSVILRWQARLDSEWADRVLPWVTAAGLFILLAALALAKARSLDGAFDLSVYTQAAWLIHDGQEPVSTLTGSGANLLAQQAAFLFYPMLAATYVLPIIPALLLIQAAALALAVVPLWRIARRLANLRVGATVALVFVYAFYPVMHNLNLDGFHPGVVAVPGLLAAFYFAAVNRWVLFGLCCAVVVASRADLGLAVAGLGAYLVLDGKRRAGGITLAVALGWTVVAALVVQPALGDGTFPHLTAFAAFGDSPGSVAWGMLTHPGEVLGRLTDELNFELALTLLAPVLFLPLVAPRYLLPIVPLELLYLVADVSPDSRFGAQTVAVTAFIFIATAFALSRMGRMGVEKVTVDPRLLGALVIAGALFFVGDAAASPYQRPWSWGGQDAMDNARDEAADLLGHDRSVRSTSSMLQVLAERPVLYPLDTAVPDPAAAAAGVDAVVVDGRDVARWSATERLVFWQGLEAQGLTVRFDEQGIVVFERPPPG